MEPNNQSQTEDVLENPIPENTSISASKKGKKSFLIFTLMLLPVLLLIGLVVYLLFTKINVKQAVAPQPFITTFEECIKTQGYQIINSYPRECKSAEKITYIEKIKEPIDTSKWVVFDKIPAFTFLCPPNWCEKTPKDDNQVLISKNGIIAMNIFLITPSNFQKSQLRHPSFAYPISWFNSLLTKNKNAVTAPLSTRIYAPGTDGYSDPLYTGFDLSKMENINVASKSAVFFPSSSGYGNVVIKLDNSNIILFFNYNPKNPFTKVILNSIVPTAK